MTMFLFLCLVKPETTIQCKRRGRIIIRACLQFLHAAVFNAPEVNIDVIWHHAKWKKKEHMCCWHGGQMCHVLLGSTWACRVNPPQDAMLHGATKPPGGDSSQALHCLNASKLFWVHAIPAGGSAPGSERAYARSPRMRLASWMSLGMMVTRLAWMAHRLVSSNRPTR
mmetsp:Transcript_72099/g.145912  ORF Transcript_72099/g.145912 Transcript_72099/m.145912 type:complete len:168 (-) Transcript_72099:424-927(-)